MRETIILEDTVAPRIFGPADRWLRLVTSNLLCDVVARGDRVILNGSPESVAAARTLFEHLITLARERDLEENDIHYALTNAARAMANAEVEGLNEVLMITPHGQADPPKNEGTEGLHRSDPQKDHHLRHRSCGNGENLSRCCHGCAGAETPRGGAHHSHASGGGGWRKAGLFAGRSAGKDRPVSAAAL